MRKLDKEAMFKKDNIAEDTKTMRDRIITPIPLLSFSIAKKTIKSWPSLKFVMLKWLKKNETNRTEGANVVIVWRWSKKTLIWSLILDDKTRNAINSMNNMKSSFTLKRSKNFDREKKSTNNVKNMTKFAFNSTILLRDAWTS